MVKKNYVHKTAQFFSVGWPVAFWRQEAQTDKDFEWFEHKYPGLRHSHNLLAAVKTL